VNDVDGTATPTDSNDDSVKLNDYDAEGDPTRALLGLAPPFIGGTFIFNDDGTFVYQHDGTEPPGQDPAFGEITFTYYLNDGAVDGAVATVTIRLNRINDAPTIDVPSPNRVIDDNQTVAPFDDVTIGDEDRPGDDLSVTVLVTDEGTGALTDGNGVFTPASLTAAGFQKTGVGRYELVNPSLATDATAAIQQLVFEPTENQVLPPGTVVSRFEIQVSDGTAPLVTNNDTTVTAVSINADPVITGAGGTWTIDDNQTVRPFPAVTVTDSDNSSVTVTVSVDPADTGTFSNLGGFVDLGGGRYQITGVPAPDATAALQALTFVPTANLVPVGQTVVSTLGIEVSDGFGGLATDNSTTVTATSVNDLPQITGTVPAQPVFDNATIQPFSTTTIVDPDPDPQNPSQTQSIWVELIQIDQANGTLSNLGGFVDQGAGRYTFQGTAADATAALRGMVFTPVANQVPVGSIVVTVFAIRADDDGSGPNPTQTDSNTSIVTTPFNDAPAAEANGPYTIQPGNDLVVDARGTTDPDLGTVLTYSWDLNNDGTADFTTGSPVATIPWMAIANLGMGAGNYTAKLTVTDNGGASGTDTAPLTIGTDFQFGPPSDGTPDAYTMILANGPFGPEIRFLDTNTGAVLSKVLRAGIDTVTVTGSADDDTLTVDLSAGNPVPAGGLVFDGKAEATADALILSGGSLVLDVTHTFFDAHSGRIDVDLGISGAATIRYADLEPLTDTLQATTRRFVFTNTADQITLSDDGIDGNQIVQISSVSTSETVWFRSPLTSVTIDAGGGADVITIERLDSTFTADVIVDAGDGNDAIDASQVNRAVSLAGGAGDDTLTGGAGNDTLDGGSGSDAVGLTADADQTLMNTTLLGRGVDQLTGIEQAVLTGGAGPNLLDASAFTLGPVTLDGAGGDDTLIGGADNDSLIGGEGDDQVRQSADVDQTLADTLLTGRGQDSLAGIETAWLTGGAGANVLDATAFTLGPVTLDGADGDDTLISGGGSDS
ncbi:MAG TPA: hypothetical protein EYP14_05565, partial [Planctomycetaceae bacterium]|nr:hypothetical protein [Planctomycetaceae bacterium]